MTSKKPPAKKAAARRPRKKRETPHLPVLRAPAPTRDMHRNEPLFCGVWQDCRLAWPDSESHRVLADLLSPGRGHA